MGFALGNEQKKITKKMGNKDKANLDEIKLKIKIEKNSIEKKQ